MSDCTININYDSININYDSININFIIMILRFPVSHGIAGHVARTGEIVLCENVANDDRFNSQVDLRTGYQTKSILCGPLTINGDIIGVIELINKRNGESFALNDKELFAKYIEHSSKIYGTAKVITNQAML